MNVMSNGRKLKIFTWHVHGNYLYYLTRTPCEFYVPFNKYRSPGYTGRSGSLPWGDNVIEIPCDEVEDYDFDLILYQSAKNYEEDRFVFLSEEQRRLPYIFLEHDPPRESPTDTRHPVDDPHALIVHVTHFNRLMWDNNRTPAVVIPHGVEPVGLARATGELEKGIVVVNNIRRRGRRLGLDLFEQMREIIPLDIVGMGSEEVGGIGEIPNDELSSFIARYRFFFNPIRYTSLGLGVLEGMMTGLPVVGLATTEMAVTIRNGWSGYIHTNPIYLAERMKELLADPEEARRLGENARAFALEHHSIEPFRIRWMETFGAMVEQSKTQTLQTHSIQ